MEFSGREFSWAEGMEQRDDETDEKDKTRGNKRFQTESSWFEMKFHLFPGGSPGTEPYRMNEIISGDGANLLQVKLLCSEETSPRGEKFISYHLYVEKCCGQYIYIYIYCIFFLRNARINKRNFIKNNSFERFLICILIKKGEKNNNNKKRN